jgi:hypothetical protein
MRRLIRNSILSLLVLSATSKVHAQSVQPSPAEQRANRLHHRAVELQSDPEQLLEAARLHRREANLRASGDPRGLTCLTLASYLTLYAGRPGDARFIMEQVADEALYQGDAYRAAKAYVEAAFMADRQGKGEDVRKYADRAKLLANAPGVSSAQREEVLARLSYSLAAASAKD